MPAGWTIAVLAAVTVGAVASIGFGVLPEAAGPVIASDGSPLAEEPSLWRRIVVWVFEQQREFHRTLMENLKYLSSEGSATAAWSLILASFLYGVFHAAGPGHGKAVITAYLLTHRQHLSRALVLAIAAALFQGVVAITVIYGLIYVVGWVPRQTQGAIDWAERLSFLLVAMIGLFLIYRAARALWARRKAAAVGVDATTGDATERVHAQCCGHAHMPSPGQVDRARSLRTTIGVVLSIGLRPCSGAVIVLVFAQVVALPWAGIGAVLAMSVGTAMAVSTLALIAVSARQWSALLLARTGRGSALGAAIVAACGGAFILWIGIMLLMSSFRPPHPLGF